MPKDIIRNYIKEKATKSILHYYFWSAECTKFVRVFSKWNVIIFKYIKIYIQLGNIFHISIQLIYQLVLILKKNHIKEKWKVSFRHNYQ